MRYCTGKQKNITFSSLVADIFPTHPYGKLDTVDWTFNATWTVTDPCKLSGTWMPISWSPELDSYHRVGQPFFLHYVWDEATKEKSEDAKTEIHAEPITHVSDAIFEIPPSGLYRGTFWTGETPEELGNPQHIKTTTLELNMSIRFQEPKSSDDGIIIGDIETKLKGEHDCSVPALSAGCVIGILQRRCRRLRCQVFRPPSEAESDTSAPLLKGASKRKKTKRSARSKTDQDA